ncbi:MAG: hypothetical protein IJU40_07935 [Desulfovibrionaceae bacterium]|nr:hypothetical protein [Desulfovibrionaceae bacterium]
MDLLNTELFGHLVYSESFTYDELLDTEERLMQDIEYLLDRAEAEHMEFNPLGDALMFQCEFTHNKLYIFRKLACELVKVLPQGITGRLLYLSHNLGFQALYWLKPREWQEQITKFSLDPPEGLRSWRS